MVITLINNKKKQHFIEKKQANLQLSFWLKIALHTTQVLKFFSSKSFMQ